MRLAIRDMFNGGHKCVDEPQFSQDDYEAT